MMKSLKSIIVLLALSLNCLRVTIVQGKIYPQTYKKLGSIGKFNLSQVSNSTLLAFDITDDAKLLCDLETHVSAHADHPNPYVDGIVCRGISANIKQQQSRQQSRDFPPIFLGTGKNQKEFFILQQIEDEFSKADVNIYQN